MTTHISLTNFDKFIERNSLQKKEYQADGVRWILNNEIHGVSIPFSNKENLIIRGGIIADEMGLGKTIQIIGAILCNFKLKTLIVLPYMLLAQWKKIIIDMLGHQPLIYHGIAKKNITPQSLKKTPIVLTTYAHISAKKNQTNLLHQIKWHRIVFDEAHHMKNEKTQAYLGLQALKSKIKWLITGTPVQNQKNDIIKPLLAIGLPLSYCKMVFTFKEDKQDQRERFFRHFNQNFMLRRTKADVGIQLPKCTQETIIIPWKDKNTLLLAREIHTILFSNPELLKDKTNHSNFGETETLLGDDDGGRVLSAITRSKQLCIYPHLLTPVFDSLFLESPYLKHNEVLQKYYSAVYNNSQKLDTIIDKINTNKSNGNPKIVFTTFHKETDYIDFKLKSLGFTVESVDGRTPKTQRDTKFASKPDVLILQIVAGSEGLNLQHYNEIYIISPPWNPAIEMQAIARCHRIGQINDVHVYKFIMDNLNYVPSLDYYCSYLLDSKRDLAKIMINGYGIPEKKCNMRNYIIQ